MKKQIPFTELADVDIRRVNKEDLADVSGLILDNGVPQEQRAARLLEAVGNPYCFRVGGLGVKLEFTEDARPLQDLFIEFMGRKKSGQ